MRHPFRNFVIVALALGILGAMALAILLPPLIASRMAEEAKARHGLTFAVDGLSSLSFHDGLSVEMRDVTLTGSDTQGVPLASIGRVIVAAPLAQIFHGAPARKVTLIDPVFTFAASGPAPIVAGTTDNGGTISVPKLSRKPLEIVVQNGAVKAEDAAHDLVLSATDLSGRFMQNENGSLQVDVRGLFNGQSTEIAVTVDDVARLRQAGSPADLSLTSKAGQIVLSGRLGLAGSVGFDGSVSAQAEDARSFLSWLGLRLEGLRPNIELGLDAGLSIAQSKASFKNLAFAFGPMLAKGEVDVKARGQRPIVTADLAFNLLDLNLYQESAKLGATAAAPDLTVQWSDADLPVADLKSVNGTMKLTADRVVVGAVEAGPSSLTASLQDGALRARMETSALFGGKGTLDYSLTHGTAADMKMVLDVTGVAAKDFLGRAFGVSFLSGPVDVQVDVTAKGRHPAELVSTLAGTAKLQMLNGNLDGLDLAARAGVLKSEDAEGWGLTSGSATALTSASATATLGDGIATLQDTRLVASGFSADIAGDIDLLRRAVNLKVTPGPGLPLPVAATVKGAWDKPTLSAKLDVDEVLRDGADEVVPEAVEKVAKGAVKKAKKKLKKLFGN